MAENNNKEHCIGELFIVIFVLFCITLIVADLCSNIIEVF